MKCPCSPVHGESSPVPEAGASILLHAMLRDTEQFSFALFNPSVCIRWEIFHPAQKHLAFFAQTGIYVSKKDKQVLKYSFNASQDE